jgi:hypothetical protein
MLEFNELVRFFLEVILPRDEDGKQIQGQQWCSFPPMHATSGLNLLFVIIVKLKAEPDVIVGGVAPKNLLSVHLYLITSCSRRINSLLRHPLGVLPFVIHVLIIRHLLFPLIKILPKNHSSIVHVLIRRHLLISTGHLLFITF